MGIDATLYSLLNGLERIEKAFESLSKPQDNESFVLITTKQAGDMIGASSEYIRSLQDRGDLDLVFLPGSKHRRVKKWQVLELIEKNTFKRAVKK